MRYFKKNLQLFTISILTIALAMFLPVNVAYAQDREANSAQNNNRESNSAQNNDRESNSAQSDRESNSAQQDGDGGSQSGGNERGAESGGQVQGDDVPSNSDERTEHLIDFFDPSGLSCVGASSSTEGGTTTFPQPTLDLFEQNKEKITAKQDVYEKAAQKEGLPWPMIAALHWREAMSDPNQSILSGEQLGTTNPDNPELSSGTLQESADNAAAHIKRMANMVYNVELKESGNSFEDLQKAFLSYNRGFLYKNAGVEPGQSPYVMNGYDREHMNMSWGRGDTVSGTDGNKLGALTVYTLLGGEGAGTACSSGTDAFVNSAGYAFPVGLPKAEASRGSRPNPNAPVFCPSICHHDGTGALDIAHWDTVSRGNDGKSVGVSVFAIDDGEMGPVKNYQGISGCEHFQLIGDDGWWYWYGHIANTTAQGGQKVRAGEKITQIGPRKCTGNGSYPHLHIDRGYPKGHYGGSVCCRDIGFVALVNGIYREMPWGGARSAGGSQ